MGGILSALTRKQPKPRGFRYKPRYYNADKAEFQAYVEKLRAERDARDRGEYRPDFKGKFTSKTKRGSAYQRQIALYNLKLIVVLIVVCIAAYYLSESGHISKGINSFLEVFSKKNGLY
ncbi:MAG: hypothetical protein R2852_01160 [Bacteroidia bacterium]